MRNSRGQIGAGYTLAEQLLHGRLVRPEAMMREFGFNYTSDMLAFFQRELPSFETLLKLNKRKAVLVPRPPLDMSFEQVCTMCEPFFFDDSNGRLEKKRLDTNLRLESVETGGWMVLRSKPVYPKRKPTYSPSQRCPFEACGTTTLSHVMYCASALRRCQGVLLFRTCEVLTTSQMEGKPMKFGLNGEEGFVFRTYHSQMEGCIGMASEIKI